MTEPHDAEALGAPAPRRAVFRSLRHRNARIFFVGLLVSNIGTWVQMTATSMLVYDLTGTATSTGISLLCQFLPMLLLGGWAGAVADRRDRRRMALLTQAGMAVQAVALGLATLAGWASLPLLYSLSLVLGVLGALDNPARRGFVIELVEPDEITNVVALNTAVMTGSRVIGPALAALLRNVLGGGEAIGWLFLLNGVSFAAILWSLAAIDQRSLRPTPLAPRGGRPVREAVAFIVGDRRLRTVFVVFTLVATFAFNYSVSLLKIADRSYGSKEAYGLLLAVTGIGSVVGSLLTARLTRVTTRYYFGAGTLLGVSGLLMAWAPALWAALLLGIPVGIGGAAFISAQNAIVQQESPPDMRGRLLALGAVAFLGSTPVGAPITGLIADHVSAGWSLGYGSVVALAACAVGWRARRRDARSVAAGAGASATLSA
ncbi:MAG: MFS transporter [Ilumatobacteraceae bacterium]